jgi:pyruvate/2-oxoglutarate/acetoin dehydrogenase E1 component
VHDALDAAGKLTGHGVDAEVIDLRTLRPWDRETVLASVRRTGRVLVVEEGPETGGWAGEILAAVAHEALDHLDDAWRLTTPDVPIPYSPPLEDAHYPGTDQIVASVLERLAVG